MGEHARTTSQNNIGSPFYNMRAIVNRISANHLCYNNIRMKKIITETCAALLILLFAYSATAKLVDINVFKGDMHRQPLPAVLQNILIILVPAAEIVAAVLLAIPRTRLKGFYLSAFIMFVFTLYAVMILSMFFGSIPCSCGGLIHNLTWHQHLWFNIFFFIVSVTGILLSRSSTKFFIAINQVSSRKS